MPSTWSKLVPQLGRFDCRLRRTFAGNALLLQSSHLQRPLSGEVSFQDPISRKSSSSFQQWFCRFSTYADWTQHLVEDNAREPSFTPAVQSSLGEFVWAPVRKSSCRLPSPILLFLRSRSTASLTQHIVAASSAHNPHRRATVKPAGPGSPTPKQERRHARKYVQVRILLPDPLSVQKKKTIAT
ncbi:unnamed protein product, partial [Mesorhabditis spiculigera]